MFLIANHIGLLLYTYMWYVVQLGKEVGEPAVVEEKQVWVICTKKIQSRIQLYMLFLPVIIPTLRILILYRLCV